MKRSIGKNCLPVGRNHGEKHDGLVIERGKMRQVFGHAIIDECGSRKSQEDLNRNHRDGVVPAPNSRRLSSLESPTTPSGVGGHVFGLLAARHAAKTAFISHSAPRSNP